MNIQTKEKKISCSVCIATFKRPLLLKELIKSLLEQEGIQDISLDIIIADNDISQSAKEIVGEFQKKSEIEISYYTQPEQNISLTRNLALKKAKGQFIAIVDDDEFADKKWLSELIKTAINYNADAVFGYVEAVFPENVPRWIKQRELYFQPMGKTGSKPLFKYSGNCLIRKDFIKKYKIYFNPQYGLSGGEDSVFFDSMERMGAKFVVSREAITYEKIPEYRATVKFIFNRFYQRGNNYGRIFIESHKSKPHQARIWLFIKSIIASFIYGVGVILLYPAKKKWIFSLKNFAANLGKISVLLNNSVYIYKYEHSKFDIKI